MSLPHPLTLALRHLTAERRVDGVASLPLVFGADGRPNLDALSALVQRTYASGLTPAVNLFAGSADLLRPDERTDVLAVTAGVARGRRFLAGAIVGDEPGSIATRYATASELIVRQGGTPVLVHCRELVGLEEERVAESYRQATSPFRDVVALEADPQFGGRVYSLDLYHRLLDVPSLSGLVHASLDRVAEWYRVDARDARRPEFRLFSGHEGAIDMMLYGSDYLLGTAGCAPEAFALRDRLWRGGDPHALEVNDVLQHLGNLLHRTPVSASRHGAAQWLAVREAARDFSSRERFSQAPPPLERAHTRALERPDSDLALLRDVSDRLDALVAAHGRVRAHAAAARATWRL